MGFQATHSLADPTFRIFTLDTPIPGISTGMSAVFPVADIVAEIVFIVVFTGDLTIVTVRVKDPLIPLRVMIAVGVFAPRHRVPANRLSPRGVMDVPLSAAGVVV